MGDLVPMKAPEATTEAPKMEKPETVDSTPEIDGIFKRIGKRIWAVLSGKRIETEFSYEGSRIRVLLENVPSEKLADTFAGFSEEDVTAALAIGSGKSYHLKPEQAENGVTGYKQHLLHQIAQMKDGKEDPVANRIPSLTIENFSRSIASFVRAQAILRNRWAKDRGARIRLTKEDLNATPKVGNKPTLAYLDEMKDFISDIVAAIGNKSLENTFNLAFADTTDGWHENFTEETQQSRIQEALEGFGAKFKNTFSKYVNTPAGYEKLLEIAGKYEDRPKQKKEEKVEKPAETKAENPAKAKTEKPEAPKTEEKPKASEEKEKLAA